jgi:hypothetical protein
MNEMLRVLLKLANVLNGVLVVEVGDVEIW